MGKQVPKSNCSSIISQDMDEKNNTLLRTRDAAVYTGLSESTFEKMKFNGRGPKYIKVPGGRAVRYRKSDLDDWLNSGFCG